VHYCRLEWVADVGTITFVTAANYNYYDLRNVLVKSNKLFVYVDSMVTILYTPVPYSYILPGVK